MKKLIITNILLAFSLLSNAEIQMTSIFSDNMMFQCNQPLKVWGLATASSNVTVEFSGQKKSTKADINGKWSLYLDEIKANKTPQEMVVYEDEKEDKRIKNILVGEVWILGGQSNMGLATRWCYGAEEIKKRANYPNIRYFKQDTDVPEKEPIEIRKTGSWSECSPQTVINYSAVGLYFAEALQKDIDIPIGLIQTALGSSKIDAHTPFEFIESSPLSMKNYDECYKKNEDFDYDKALVEWEQKLSKWEIDSKKARNAKTPIPTKPYKPTRYSNKTPSYLYNANIAHFAEFRVQGAIWYQGESNSAPLYLSNFVAQTKNLIDGWRAKFNNDDLDFLIVQLPSFTESKSQAWLNVRIEQSKIAKLLKKCYVVNIADIGEKDVHPKDKLEVGQRVEKLALNKIYGLKKGNAQGPQATNAKFANNLVRISFDLDGSKLTTKGKSRGLEVKVDGIWENAIGVQKGNGIIVKSQNNASKKIEAVRYLYYNWSKPETWLWNTDNVPAFQFYFENN